MEVSGQGSGREESMGEDQLDEIIGNFAREEIFCRLAI